MCGAFSIDGVRALKRGRDLTVRSLMAVCGRDPGGAVAVLSVWCGLVTATVPCVLRAQQPEQVLLAAESALALGHRDRAVRLATSYTERAPRDARGWLVLGRARLQPSTASPGQPLPALLAFRRATEIEPRGLEGWRWLGRAGMRLGGADGESAARKAWERLLALDPADGPAWAEWLTLSRGRAERVRMVRALAQQPESPQARERSARLLIEEEHYDSANALLAQLLLDDPRNAALLALRAQSAFEAGDLPTGGRFYNQGLHNADRDLEGVLWSQVIGIANTAEVRVWEAGVPPASRQAFLEGFWARRNPDLFQEVNARIAEHFARLRVARRRWSLQHALVAYHRSTAARASEHRPSPAEDLFYLRCEAQEWADAPMRAADRARLPFTESGADPRYQPGVQVPGDLDLSPGPGALPLVSPFSRNLRDVDTVATSVGYNRKSGLDDRGITYLRLGAPRRMVVGAPNVEDAFCRVPDVERWDYPGVGQVRFFRPSAVGLGLLAGMRQTSDMVVRAQNEEQFRGMTASLTTDTTSVPAPLAIGVWFAQFRNARDSSQVDLAVFATAPRVAAQLVGALGVPPLRALGVSGLAQLTARAGSYALLVHGLNGDTLGRRTLRVRVRPMARNPTISDLVLAPAWADTVVDRATMLTLAPRDLFIDADSAIRLYAEVYGLRQAADGLAPFNVTYQIYATSNLTRDAQRDSLPGGIVISFDRVPRAPGPITKEWLDLRPDVPPGRYLLRLTVRESAGGAVVGRSQIGFEIGER